MTSPVARTLPFTGIDNFRDYGGYALSGGGRLRSDMLYRSAHHGDASAEDLDILGALQISSVIDLRGPGERLKQPSPRPKGFGGRVFESNLETSKVAPHIEAAVKGVANAAEARAALESVYAAMPCMPAMVATLRGYFTALAETDGPSLVHCSAGKDRTGVAVALLQTSLGVHRDDVMADYLLTNTVGRFKERLKANVAAIHKNFGMHIGEEAARTLVRVEPAYLEAAFRGIEQRFGSLESYMREAMGVDQPWRERVLKRLTV